MGAACFFQPGEREQEQTTRPRQEGNREALSDQTKVVSTCGLHTKEIIVWMKADISVTHFRQNMGLTFGSLLNHDYVIAETKNHLINYSLINFYLCVFDYFV